MHLYARQEAPGTPTEPPEKNSQPGNFSTEPPEFSPEAPNFPAEAPVDRKEPAILGASGAPGATHFC